MDCILEGNKINSLADAYEELARQLEFPDWFGENLDALWDILSAEIEGPICIIWKNAERSKATMGDHFNKLTELLREVENARDDFTFEQN
jgi:ribonuclease inhibitor